MVFSHVLFCSIQFTLKYDVDLSDYTFLLSSKAGMFLSHGSQCIKNKHSDRDVAKTWLKTKAKLSITLKNAVYF